MAVVIVVTKNKQHVVKAIVDKPEFVIGRSSRCDLRLSDEEKRVSREHAMIRQQGDGYELSDRGSRNGTVLNGKPVAEPVTISDGDTIEIGAYEMRVHLSDAAVVAAADDGGETAFMDEGKLRRKGVKGMKRGPKRSAPAGTRITLRAVDGPLAGTVFRDPGEEVVIGRAEGCAIILPDDSVSKQHARLTRTPAGWTVQNLSQSNGTFVEGRRIEALDLATGQKIRIGTTTFLFTETDPRRRKRIIFGTVGLLVALLLIGGLVKALKPEDPALKLVALGTRQLKAGDYERAEVTFEQALTVSAHNADAKRGLKLTRQRRETDALIAVAKSSADAGDFDAALNTCYDILRIDGKHAEARELEGVLKAVGQARVAFESRNWVEAIDLIRGSLQRFSGSDVLSNLLVRAHSEVKAESDLGRAKEAFGLAKYDAARPLLEGIDPKSCYRPEAVELLDKMVRAEGVDASLKAAWQAYRSGDLETARTCVAVGLEQDPTHQALRNLRARVEQLAPLAARLTENAGAVAGEDVETLRDLCEACRGIIDAETDAANELRISAMRTLDAAGQRLIELGRLWQSRADALLAAERKKEALEMYRRSLLADPGNAGVQTASRRLNEEIEQVCRKQFTQGKLHEELQQKDLAIKAYEAVLEAAPVGSEYHQKARERLQHVR